MGKTLFEKIWDAHVVGEEAGQTILYIDKHLIHEVTTPQGFEGLRLAQRKVRRPDATLGVIDHIIPTVNQSSACRSSTWATRATGSSTWWGRNRGPRCRA
jgi:3-isopropylmalate/(R)-2-methylmalate dehydratase large subunit